MGNKGAGMWPDMQDGQKEAMGEDADAKEASRIDEYRKRHSCLWEAP